MTEVKITLTSASGVEHDITEPVAFMYDAIIQSLDWGSGFLDLEEQLNIALVGVLAGYQVPTDIPIKNAPRRPGWDYSGEELKAARGRWEKDMARLIREECLRAFDITDMEDEDD